MYTRGRIEEHGDEDVTTNYKLQTTNKAGQGKVDTDRQGRSKLFKSAGDGCSLFVNNKKDEFNDRRVQKV